MGGGDYIRAFLARTFQSWSGRLDPSSGRKSPPADNFTPAPSQEFPITGASEETDARALFAATKELDPFPDIPPALLNSAHIEDYMLQTAMVFPYQRDRRKSAAYAMRVGSGIAFRDPAASERAELPVRQLNNRQAFELPPNSITYVQTKELFQLPNYIAVRFNLHIDLVHKGLLLGTGPLVDPGFSGRLVVPLHNMTANTYYLAEDDEFIWVEFTKTSMTDGWLGRKGDPARPKLTGTFEKFPKIKTQVPMEEYFKRALRPHPSRPTDQSSEFPVNATPSVVAEANRNAINARDDAAGARLIVKRIAWGSIIGGSLAAFALIYGSFQTTVAAIQQLDAATDRVGALEIQVMEMKGPLAIQNAEAARREFCALGLSQESSAESRRRLLVAVRAAEREANRVADSINKPLPYPARRNASGKEVAIVCP